MKEVRETFEAIKSKTIVSADLNRLLTSVQPNLTLEQATVGRTILMRTDALWR